ncbi:MAG: M48 family metalloprotease [Selenomonadaceae bacterium]|nr:M48 family metalloprotease [Selenomonadaceae bacterium]
MNLKKKFLSAVTAATLVVSFIFGTPVAQASLIGTAIGIGTTLAEGAAMRKQVKEIIKKFNETPEGQEALYQNFREKQGVDTTPEYNERLDIIMANLTRGVAAVDPSIKDKPYKYFVADNDALNAACAMGHVMMVNRGTFKALPSEDEIAAIVGHEMGHGQLNHGVKSLEKQVNQRITSGLVGAAIGGGAITSLIADVALNNMDAHKDKKFETQADLISIDYLVNTPYNIGATAAVMQRFVELSIGKERSRLTAIFKPSDHPDSAKRRDAAAKKLFEYSGKHVEVKNGVVSVNKKTFMKPVASSTMSGAERSYFVMGNLARAFHDGQNKNEATVVNGTVMLGNQEIVTPLEGDEDAQVIADRLNSLK